MAFIGKSFRKREANGKQNKKRKKKKLLWFYRMWLSAIEFELWADKSPPTPSNPVARIKLKQTRKTWVNFRSFEFQSVGTLLLVTLLRLRPSPQLHFLCDRWCCMSDGRFLFSREQKQQRNKKRASRMSMPAPLTICSNQLFQVHSKRTFVFIVSTQSVRKIYIHQTWESQSETFHWIKSFDNPKTKCAYSHSVVFFCSV